MGGQKECELLRLARGRFDVFLTADQNLTFQQKLKKIDIAIFVCAAPNRYRSLRLLMPRVLETLQPIKVGDIVWVQP
jgi:hypothetical protein